MPNSLFESDAALAAAITAYMQSHKLVTRGELKRKHNTSLDRLERLENEGLVTLPPKLSKSAGATLGRKKSNTCANWFINKPAPWQTSKPTRKALNHA